MNKERDKFLHEAIGIKYHDYEYDYGGFYCKTCNWQGYECDPYIVYHINIDFSSWDGFGKLLKWFSNKCQTDDEFYANFEEQNYSNSWIECTGPYVYMFELTPDKFANAIYEYLKNNPYSM